MSDRKEYANEQDYSLNAGRYVGVEIEDDKISEEAFVYYLKQNTRLADWINQAHMLEVE